MKFSKNFARIYDPFMFFIEKRVLLHRRRRLIENLKGEILEVGVGTGVNFEHYGHGASVLGIEPSPHMIRIAHLKKDRFDPAKDISLHTTGMGHPEMDHLVQPASLDAIVSTLVLCTVPDVEGSIKNFYDWLKPGGRLVVLEHIRSHKHIHGKIQDLLTPFWMQLAEGCQLNRATDRMILEAGFVLKREERFKLGFPFYEAEYEKPGA